MTNQITRMQIDKVLMVTSRHAEELWKAPKKWDGFAEEVNSNARLLDWEIYDSGYRLMLVNEDERDLDVFVIEYQVDDEGDAHWNMYLEEAIEA